MRATVKAMWFVWNCVRKMNNLLQDILYGVRLKRVVGSTDQTITGICTDSRQAKPGVLFAAISGTQLDGHDYIPAAIKGGAIAIVCQHAPAALQPDLGIVYLVVDDVAKALGTIAGNHYEKPSEKLQLIGITGTNGKTTTATLLYQTFKSLGYKVGLLSTIKYIIGTSEMEATHTTPDVVKLNRLLDQMVQNGCDYCFMEVSSHAVVQGRIDGISFAGGILTNISHDHLDYHGSFKAYINAKKGFFDGLPSKAFALVNTDDKRARVMLQNTAARKYSYALKSLADFRIKILENEFTGLTLKINELELHSFLVGEFNAYNLLAIYACAMLLEQDKTEVLTAISALKTAEGRFDCISNPQSQIIGIVDYAHTPDALKNVLDTVNKIRTKNEQLITVVGCGGDRDKAKRPIMAKIACENSDKVILTSDNPRTEEPNAIIKDMQTGVEPQHFNKTLSITNRREAIKTACMLSKPGDIILLAGKGHEKYQEVNGVKHPFDDKHELSAALKTV